MLLEARHEDGSPMSDIELRDELMTLLVAGHETTASSLAWAFERIARTPRVGERLAEAVAADDDAYVIATIQETLRRRPVIPNAAPRLVKKPVTIGGWDYPPDILLVASAYLVQHDPEIYPDPYEFRPERFLDESPGTYTWIPFGGGRRRCLGASFAQLEMKLVLKAVFAGTAIEPAAAPMETPRRRAITISPRVGAKVVLTPGSTNVRPRKGGGRGSLNIRWADDTNPPYIHRDPGRQRSNRRHAWCGAVVGSRARQRACTYSIWKITKRENVTCRKAKKVLKGDPKRSSVMGRSSPAGAAPTAGTSSPRASATRGARRASSTVRQK